MKRGELWTVSGGPDYISKPRPVLIVQDDAYRDMDSITLCGFTTDLQVASQFRILVLPTAKNSLQFPSMLMVDKVTTIPRAKLGARIGELSSTDMSHVNRAMLVFLGLAGGTR